MKTKFFLLLICCIGSFEAFAQSGDHTTGALNSLVSITTGGDWNTACGFNTLQNLTTGDGNVAVGFDALQQNQTGIHNTGIGYGALKYNMASYNIGIGNKAIGTDSNGQYNTAIGNKCMEYSNGGSSNVAMGFASLQASGNYSNNVAIGRDALYNNIGSSNTAVGLSAGASVTTGGNNTFLGCYAGQNLQTGLYNVFIGRVSVSALGTTATTIGNDGSGNIILADGVNNQRLIIYGGDAGTNARAGYMGIGLANNSIPNNRLEVKSSFATGAGASGLRLTNLTTADTPVTNPGNGVLTVNASGDVILVTDKTGTGTSGADISIYTHDGTIDLTASTPGTAGTRTVTMGESNLWFRTNGSFENGDEGTGRIYIGTDMLLPDLNTVGPNFSQYRLLVEGGVLTEKVKVALRDGADWADYVFADGYKLMPLKDVEAFVKAKKHLPGIESSEELSKTGLDLGAMQSKQMGKIEELTLHLIAQNKVLEKQSKEIEELKAQVKLLLERK